MTLESIYFISQIAAALGVMASLIFVGLQIRQGTSQAKADAAEAAHRSFQEWYQSATPEQVALNARAMRDFSSLSGEEQQLVYLFGMRMLINMQEIHSKWSDGSFPEDRWQFWDAWVSIVMSPMVNTIWENRRFMFSTRFQTYFDGKAAEKATPREGSPWGLAGGQVESADDAARLETPSHEEPDA